VPVTLVWFHPALTLGRRCPRSRARRCGLAKSQPGTAGTPPGIAWLVDGGSGPGASPGPESRGPLVDRLVVTAACGICRTGAAPDSARSGGSRVFVAT
jgi:hypothetical protein